MPVLVYKAIADQLTNIHTTDDHVARICGVGANVLYLRNTFGMHGEEEISGGPLGLQWLSDVVDGKRPEPLVGCKVENVTRTP